MESWLERVGGFTPTPLEPPAAEVASKASAECGGRDVHEGGGSGHEAVARAGENARDGETQGVEHDGARDNYQDEHHERFHPPSVEGPDGTSVGKSGGTYTNSLKK